MKQKKVITSIYIADLISRYLLDELEENEKSELFNWVHSKPQNLQLFEQLLQEDHLEQQGQSLKMFDTVAALEKTKSRKSAPLPLVRSNFRLWKMSGAAAAILAILSTIFYLYPAYRPNNSKQDIEPGKNAATLILSNGKKLFLTDSIGGKLAEESGVRISKNAQGLLIYELIDAGSTIPAQVAATNKQHSIKYNTLFTARGQQYQVNLPDGTTVWLNAASSLKFPSNFEHSNNRAVELSGEAFFEVAKDKHRPFIVKTAGQQVRVLGTHFNISAYPDEQSTKTTLLEGSVNVKLAHGSGSKILIPGQQSEILKDNIKINTQVDIEEITAWKNGYFKFNERLERIMTKISRWYDIEVVYEVNPAADLEFGAKISRTRTLSELLKLIELTGGVHFKIEGRRVTVTK